MELEMLRLASYGIPTMNLDEYSSESSSSSSRAVAAASARAAPSLLIRSCSSSSGSSSTAAAGAAAMPFTCARELIAGAEKIERLKEQYTGTPECPFVEREWCRKLIAFKVCFIGDSGVGKTSLFLSFQNGCKGTGALPHIITPGCDVSHLYMPLFTATRTALAFQVWDTAGQERYRTITAGYIRAANVVLIVYNVNQPQSLENLKLYWWNEVNLRANDSTRKIFVANQIDTLDTIAVAAARHKHASEIEAALHVTLDEHNFHMVSATTGTGVLDLFMAMKASCCENSPQIEKARREVAELGAPDSTYVPERAPNTLFLTGQPHSRSHQSGTSTVATASSSSGGGCGC